MGSCGAEYAGKRHGVLSRTCCSRQRHKKEHASIKSNFHIMCMHLEQKLGNTMNAKCNCKVDQGGWKHIGNLLYSHVDIHFNMGIKEIAKDLICTQVGQQCQICISWCRQPILKAFNFEELVF